MCLLAHCKAGKLPMCQASPEARLSSAAETLSVSFLLLKRSVMQAILKSEPIRPVLEIKTNASED